MSVSRHVFTYTCTHLDTVQIPTSSHSDMQGFSSLGLLTVCFVTFFVETIKQKRLACEFGDWSFVKQQEVVQKTYSHIVSSSSLQKVQENQY